MKTCKKCGLQKDLAEFPVEKRNKDGLNGTCRICCNARARAWYAGNPDLVQGIYDRKREKTSLRSAEYYKNNSEAIKARSAKRYRDKKEQMREYAREYSAKNSEKIVDRVRNWRLRNPDRKIIHNQNRRAMKIANGGTLSPDIVKRLMSLQKGRCAACRCDLSKSGRHLDHVIPLSLGGANADLNVQLLCPTCNTQKNCAHPVDFMQRKGFLL